MTDGSLGLFWDRLSRHDWFHMMSDDPGVYRRGQKEADAIHRQAVDCGPEFLELYRTYKKAMWDRTEPPPRPES